MRSSLKRSLQLKTCCRTALAILCFGLLACQQTPTADGDKSPKGSPRSKYILQVTESAGFVPADIALKSMKNPICFHLMEDGLVRYRGHDFQYYSCTLSSAEIAELTEPLLEKDFLKLKKSGDSDMVIMDATNYKVQLNTKNSKSHVWNLQRIVPKLRHLLEFKHDKAKKIEAPKFK